MILYINDYYVQTQSYGLFEKIDKRFAYFFAKCGRINKIS